MTSAIFWEFWNPLSPCRQFFSTIRWQFWPLPIADNGRPLKAKHCWALSTNFKNKQFVHIPQQCFAVLPQVNFPANNLNFHWRWRWWSWIQAIFLNLFYFKLERIATHSYETDTLATLILFLKWLYLSAEISSIHSCQTISHFISCNNSTPPPIYNLWKFDIFCKTKNRK